MKQFIIALLIIAVVLAAAFSISFYIETNFETLDTLASEMFEPVSYTHLDVYKRQSSSRPRRRSRRAPLCRYPPRWRPG